MDNLATAMTSKAGCLDQLTARNSHGLYSRSLEQNVQRLVGLFLRQTNKIKNTNRPKRQKGKKKKRLRSNRNTTEIAKNYILSFSIRLVYFCFRRCLCHFEAIN